MEDSIIKHLRMIASRRLLFDTWEALGQHIGHALSPHSKLHKIGGKNPVRRKAIYYQLCHEVKHNYEINLETLLQDYRAVSATFKNRRPCAYKCGQPLTTAKERKTIVTLLDKFEEGERYQKSIALLIYYGLIPKATGKAEDAHNMQDMLAALKDILTALSKSYLRMNFHGALNVLSERFQAEEPHRIDLIWLAHNMINYLIQFSTEEQRYELSATIQRQMLYFDLKGIWVEAAEANTTFWHIIELSNGCTFRRCHFSDAERSIEYTDYFVNFFKCEQGILADIFHPTYVKGIIVDGEISSSMHGLYGLVLDKSSKPETLSFVKLQVDALFRFDGIALKRAENAEDYCKRWENYEPKNTHPDYCFLVGHDIAHMTQTHIYVRRPNGGYYCVPRHRHPGLAQITIDAPVGVITLLGRHYLAFDPLLWYLEVTTEEHLNEYDITACDELPLSE